MPIYEFRCLSCGHIFEILSLVGEAEVSIQCTQCGGEEAQRLLSRVAYSMSDGSGREFAGPVATTRSCAEGSCGSVTLAGHTRES